MDSQDEKTLLQHKDLLEAPACKGEPLGGELLGRQLGEYVVRRRLGSGGMGIVYEGEHVTIGRKVAIKLIRSEHADSPHARDLLSEAQAASAIRHHGIIEIFGLGHLPGVGQYLIMEYLEGQPLSELIHQHAPLPPAQVLRLLAEVLEALAAAHAVGVIHRDLKPANIFLVHESSGSEYVKVLDFGLAKRSSTPHGTAPQTRTSMIIGTPEYMAPEQVLSEAVGPPTDLYAVGGIGFEMLTGQRPFKGRSPMETMALHLQSPPPAPSSLVALPAEVDELILWLLAKEPRQRPSSAAAVAQEMRALATRLESWPPPQAQAPDASAARGPRAWGAAPAARLSRRRLGLAAGGLLLLAMGIAMGLASRPPPQGPGLDLLERQAPALPAATPPLLTHGTLHLIVRPFVYVVVDGQLIGRKPPQSEFSLPPGVHQLELRNEYFKPYMREITILPGMTLEHNAVLEPR